MSLSRIERLVREEVRRAMGRKVMEGEETASGAYDYYAHVAEDLRHELPLWFRWHGIDEYKSLQELVWTMEAAYPYEEGSTDGERENLSGNMGLFREAIDAYGRDYEECVGRGIRYCDMLVRHYVLSRIAYGIIREYVRKRYPGFVR